MCIRDRSTASNYFEMPIIQVIPCLRCLELDFPIRNFVDKLRDEEFIPEIPLRTKTFNAITRKSYRMRILDLEPWQYHFLSAATYPVSTNDAARAAADKLGLSSGQVLADAMLYIPQAIQDCLIAKI